MSNGQVSFSATEHIRDHCLCLHTQRAARAIARQFDGLLSPLGLTNGQFSLMIALNRPEPVSMGPVAALLGMDRTTLTAALKSLEQRGLIATTYSPEDKRSRLLTSHLARPFDAGESRSDLGRGTRRDRSLVGRVRR
jgi:DNA-binding transcriptional ArsR family regulator